MCRPFESMASPVPAGSASGSARGAAPLCQVAESRASGHLRRRILRRATPTGQSTTEITAAWEHIYYAPRQIVRRGERASERTLHPATVRRRVTGAVRAGGGVRQGRRRALSPRPMGAGHAAAAEVHSGGSSGRNDSSAAAAATEYGRALGGHHGALDQ